MDFKEKQLEAVAVEAKDIKALSTNFAEIASGCDGLEDFEPKTEIQNRYPLASWLLNTPQSRRMRNRVLNRLINYRKNEQGQPMVTIPGSIWTEVPPSTQGECCWVLPDFDKCQGEVPVNLLCLKDCDDILDSLMFQNLRIGADQAMAPFAYSGETMKTVNRRIARMWMAFFTARNLILGLDNTYTDQLKPFHGLLQLLENPAVLHIDGSSILAAFDELACRMNALGYDGFTFAAHPLIIGAIRAEVREDERGRLPEGWRYVDGELRFHGARFIEDKLVPYSVADGTGEIWMLHGDAVGAFLGTDLMPADSFIRESGTYGSGDNCGSECTYYYNYGATFNTEARKLAVIQNVSATSTCVAATADLAGLLVPQTLIPYGN